MGYICQIFLTTFGKSWGFPSGWFWGVPPSFQTISPPSKDVPIFKAKRERKSSDQRGDRVLWPMFQPFTTPEDASGYSGPWSWMVDHLGKYTTDLVVKNHRGKLHRIEVMNSGVGINSAMFFGFTMKRVRWKMMDLTMWPTWREESDEPVDGMGHPILKQTTTIKKIAVHRMLLK